MEDSGKLFRIFKGVVRFTHTNINKRINGSFFFFIEYEFGLDIISSLIAEGFVFFCLFNLRHPVGKKTL